MNWDVALGAGILFITNLVIIILASSIIFQLHGLSPEGGRKNFPAYIARIVALLIVISLLLSAPLGYQLNSQIKKGQVRPVSMPLNRDLHESLYARARKEMGVDLITAMRAGVKRKFDVSIILSAKGKVNSDFISEMEKIVKDFLGANTVVYVVVLKSSDMNYQGVTTITSEDVKNFKKP